MTYEEIVSLLGKESENLFTHESKTISKDMLHKTGGDVVDNQFINSNRNAQVLRSIASLYNHGRLGRYRVFVYFTYRPGHRAHWWCIVCSQPYLLRSGKTS